MIRTYNMANGEMLEQQQVSAKAFQVPEGHPVDISFPMTQLQEVSLEAEQKVSGIPADLAQVSVDKFLDRQ